VIQSSDQASSGLQGGAVDIEGINIVIPCYKCAEMLKVNAVD
jgi:hypothetical protein